MKQPTFNGKELLPLSVMEAAHAGDAMAMERVLRYYEGYINKLCTRTLYDSNGFPYGTTPFRRILCSCGGTADYSFCFPGSLPPKHFPAA